MKKILIVLLALTTISGLNKASAQEKAKWKEMETFHEVMAQTFHPSEEGKLQPVRTRSQEIVDKATAWENSSAPEGYNKKAVKKSLKELVKGSKEIHSLVRSNASDEVLKSKLSSLHDVFHQIMEKCENGDH